MRKLRSEGDEVERRHPPHWGVVVGQRREEICRRRLRLIPHLRDLPQQSLSLLASLWEPHILVKADVTTEKMNLRLRTHIVVVTAALGAEGRLVVQLVLEIVLTQVAQGCAHFCVLQLFLRAKYYS